MERVTAPEWVTCLSCLSLGHLLHSFTNVLFDIYSVLDPTPPYVLPRPSWNVSSRKAQRGTLTQLADGRDEV